MASKRPSVKTKKPKERWLLTRKTWRYMADAGRRLVPEGTSNTEDDVPVIEAHFQEVCKRENRFLLWRKCSYPSALRHSRSNRKHPTGEKGLKNRAGSATELELGPVFSRLRDNKGRNSLPGVSRVPNAQKGGSKCSSNEGSGAEESRGTERLLGSPRRTRRSNSRRRGGHAGVGATCVAGVDGSLRRRDGNSEDELDNNVFEEEDDNDYVETQRSSGRSEETSSGGVKKKLSQFWRGTSDLAKQSGSIRSKNRSTKTSKTSSEEESIHKSDWHKLKSATSESDFDKYLKSESKKSTTLRKVSSTELTDINDRHIRYGVGNLPKSHFSREKVKLRHIEQSGGVTFERSISADQRTSIHNLHDNRDYFDEEAEGAWSLDRSSSFKEKHRSNINDNNSLINLKSRGGHSGYIASTPNLPSRHNLTLPGLNIARPARSSNNSHHSSDVNTTSNFTANLQHNTRTRRSGKVDNDFYSFQTHLTHWKSTSSEVSTTENNTEINLSPVQQPPPPPCITKPPVGKIPSTKQGPKFSDQGTQTLTISSSVMRSIENEIRSIEPTSPQPSPTPPSKNAIRRKSSAESARGAASVTEDCSPSVGDTILRYLRMARKKSVDGDKADRFKTVNYDRTLRYIKSKPPIEDDNVKNIQTDETWLNLSQDPHLFEEDLSDGHNTPIAIIHHVDDLHLFCSDQESSDLGFASSSRAASSRSSFDAGELTIPVPTYPTSPQSPSSPSSGHSFLAQLLHGLQQAAGNPHMSLPAAMQKSKSSSSVGHHAPRLMAKKIWRTRSKSQSRASTTSTWTPQGQCRWNSVTGRSVTLQNTSLLQLSELERRVLQQVALAKLQALNLGVNIRIPSEEAVAAAPKPKRRAYLLKRKALTTGFFDSGRKEDKDKEGSSGGLVFGIPLSQCITNDRVSEEARGVTTGSPAELRRRSHHGSRTSFSSLGDASRPDQGGSCESLPAGAGSGRVAGSVPGLLDVLSLSEDETWSCSPSVPHLVSTCCRHIMQYGLHTLGIFRVSSSKKRVRQLREDFDCGRDTELNADLCPHDAATLLKEFFRDLPDPLMCRELYPAFINTQRIRNRRLQLEAMQHLIQLLPVPNRDTLAALLAFLNTVAKHSADRRDAAGEWLVGNKMDSTNLATLFAPNILHCFRANAGAKEAAAESAEDRTDAINVTRSLIDHHGDVFEVSAELLDEVFLHMMDSHPDALDQVLRKLCFGGDDMADDGDNNSVFEGSEGSSVPRTPTEGLVTPISVALDDKDSRGWSDATRKVWSREEFLHETAGMGGPDVGMSPRNRGRERSKKRGKEDSTEGTGGSTRWFHHQSGSKKREKSSSDEGRRRSERGSTSSGCAEPATPLSSPPAPSFPCSRSPSLDDSQTSTIVGSHRDDGSGNVITASLKISVPASSFALSLDDIPYIEDERGGILSPGRRSIDSVPTSYTARPSTDSAIGSTMSPAPGSEPPVSSPSVPASPTPDHEPAGVTGRILIPALSTKMTVGTVIRRVESSTKVPEVERRPSTKVSKEDKKKYVRRRYTDSRHPTTNFPDVEALEAASTTDSSSKPSQVWKRRELIASDPKDHETFV